MKTYSLKSAFGAGFFIFLALATSKETFAGSLGALGHYEVIASKLVRVGETSFGDVSFLRSPVPFKYAQGTWLMQFSISSRYGTINQEGFLYPRFEQLWFQAESTNQAALIHFRDSIKTLRLKLALHEDLLENKDKLNCVRVINQEGEFVFNAQDGVQVKKVGTNYQQIILDDKISSDKCKAWADLLK